MTFSEADDNDPEERQPRPPGKILPLPPRPAPDWLVGADDGLGAPADPQDKAPGETPPEPIPLPVLFRPGSPEPATVPGFEPTSISSFCPAPGDVPAAPRPETDETPEPKVVEEPPPPRRSARPGVWAPVASSVPALGSVLPIVPEPNADEAPVIVPIVRPPGLPGAADGPPRPVTAPPALATLREPWWTIALDTLRTSRPVQLSAAAGVLGVVLVAYWMWPHGVGTESLSNMRRYPSQFDGRTVTVRGRVGDDVFSVGAGWAFYLMQGRDTIVTFTRSETPTPREVITVQGRVSTGFLDGIPRQALFEDPTAAP